MADRAARRRAVAKLRLRLSTNHDSVSVGLSAEHGPQCSGKLLDRPIGLTVSFDGRAVTYGFGELDTLVPAYAATIHKSQGSEYPAVVIPMMTQHYTMLQRNLLYTGVTRGKKLVVLVGHQPSPPHSIFHYGIRGRGGTIFGSAVPSCSKPSRYGLARLEHAARLVRRPTLTAPARAGVSEATVGTKKQTFGSNKETDEEKKLRRPA
jgi:hypothetical protein